MHTTVGSGSGEEQRGPGERANVAAALRLTPRHSLGALQSHCQVLQAAP